MWSLYCAELRTGRLCMITYSCVSESLLTGAWTPKVGRFSSLGGWATENAEHENAAQKCSGGKCEQRRMWSRKYRNDAATLAYSTPAVSCRIFMSRIFSAPFTGTHKTCSYYHRSFLVDRQNLIKLDVVVPDSYLDRTLRLQWVRGHVRRELAYITYLSTSMLTINPFIERSLILSYRYTLSN